MFIQISQLIIWSRIHEKEEEERDRRVESRIKSIKLVCFSV